jgi:hypothetical protein
MPLKFIRNLWVGRFCLLLVSFGASVSQGALPFYVPPEFGPFLTDARFTIPFTNPSETTDLINAQLSGGKRLRPLLCYLGAGMVGTPPENAESLACAAEWAHNASLFHDDVLDESADRRGQATLWKLTGVDGAVLLGDKLLARLTRKVLRDGGAVATDGILEVIEAMTEGEWLQRDIKQRGFFQIADWDQVARFKTGMLFGWSFAAAAMAQQAPETITAQFKSIGEALGILFQLRDDIDDSSTPEELGQINLVFLKAAEIQGGGSGPLQSGFKAEALSEAQGWARTKIKIEISSLQRRVEQLNAQVANWKHLDENGNGLRSRCVRTLTEFLEVVAK